MGVAIGNIDNANIVLSGIQLNSCFDSIPGIVSKLKDHYKFSIIKALLKTLGSLDIIGNPVNLFSNIGTGFKDLVEKPIEV